MEITKEQYSLIEKSLEDANTNNVYEFECVFSTKDLNKEIFDNVRKYLDFDTEFELIETLDRDALDISLLNTSYRVTINDHNLIVNYCKFGYLTEYKIMEKQKINNFENIKMSEYDIYFKMKSETDIKKENIKDFDLLFSQNDKYFRHKKRFSFLHKSKLFRIDMTIVKKSSKTSKTIDHSGVLSANDTFEIEIEYLNDVGKTKKKSDVIEILLCNIIEKILKEIDDTENLMTRTNKELVLCEYLKLVNSKVFDSCNNSILSHIRNVVMKKPKNFFLSYQPVTLEQPNLLEKELGILSIREEYTVTEKADGERMLLYVDSNNKVYMINSRLNIKSVGIKHKYANSLLDGEFIKRSKYNTILKHYMAFDIYFLEGNDVRNNKLIPTRYDHIKDFAKNSKSQFVIKSKTYHHGKDIFTLSKEIYKKEKYEYQIDGLIYTPMNLNVGTYYNGEDSDKYTFGKTWMNVMKWKPPEENSIDMLTTYGDEIFVPDIGRCVLCNLQISYRTNTDELLNPIKILSNDNVINKVSYIKKTFVQSYLRIEDGSKKPKSEMEEVIYNNSIVEYVYNKNESELLCWTPYRVRYDKTALYKKTNNIMNTANSYLTAINVWRSIQNPVTSNMITGVDELNGKDVMTNNVYYARNVNRTKILSKPMLLFHNKEIKSKLFGLFKNQKLSLIDMACGKGGDLYKWIENRYAFVMGFDINLDNIMNSGDGVYRRYNQASQLGNKINAIFLQKDVSSHWIDTKSIEDKYMKELYDIVWGNISKKDISNSQLLKYYNVMQNKFDVVSCQFAIHYMFESEDKLETFCANVNKVMKVGGYFMGTCLNGELVDKMLSKTVSGKKIGKINDNTVWMLEKKYETYDKTKLGQKISVYLESINRIYDEYLVNFEVLQDKLSKYNITVLNKTDLQKLKLKESINNFEDLYSKDKYNLPDELIQYSFLNSWFVFKKY